MTDFLEESRSLWDAHARRDPLWAILSDPDKKGGKWDVRRFFQTAVGEISLIFYQLRSSGIEPGRGSALDFGCGVGRLTQALAWHFDRVVGVDVSPAMIGAAEKLNQRPLTVSYVWNQAADLKIFGDDGFDFIVSNLVLQHIRPEISIEYLREFFRVLKPGGILVFQLPSHERREEDEPPAPAARAMPDDAYQASVVVAGIPERALKPASEVTLRVEVTNRSTFEWSQQQFGPIRVGNHWLDASGDRMILRDDGRTSLPDTVRSGDSCSLPLTITAPSDEGDYQCEIDLAHEGVLWFRDKGSSVVRCAVRVRLEDEGDFRSSDQPPSGQSRQATEEIAEAGDRLPDAPVFVGGDPDLDDPTAFPMYGIETDTVTRLIADHGADLVHVENDRSCGDDWVSYRYFVRKRANDQITR